MPSNKQPSLRLHSPLSEILFSVWVFYGLMFLPLIGSAFFVTGSNWWPWPTLLFMAMLLTCLMMSIEHIVLFNRLKLSQVHYDGSFRVNGSTISHDELTGIEEIILNPGFKATKYHFLLFLFESKDGTSHALCLVRDGWFLKDIMTDQSRSIRLLLERSPELKTKLLPMRIVKRRSEILPAT